MNKQILEGIGQRLEVDKQGRISLSAEYACQENWFLYYDLACENFFVLCPEFFEGEGFLKAYIKPLNIDKKGRCYIPTKFREKINGSILLKRHKHVVILLNQSTTD